MTENPYSPQNEQQPSPQFPTPVPPGDQPMNVYPAQGFYPAQANAKPASATPSSAR